MLDIEFYTDEASETRFRFVAANGEKVVASEGYTHKSSGVDTVNMIIRKIQNNEFRMVDKTGSAQADGCGE